MDMPEHDRAADEPHPQRDPAEIDDLMPRMKRTEPSQQVLRSRHEQAVRDESDRQRWERAIEAHVAAHRLALDFLEAKHQWIADAYDLDLIATLDRRRRGRWPAGASGLRD